MVGELRELVVVELNPLLSSLLGGDVCGWSVEKPDREFDREIPLGDGWVGATEYRTDSSACGVRQQLDTVRSRVVWGGGHGRGRDRLGGSQFTRGIVTE